MKLLYNLAKNNDYDTFKKALMDEVGVGGYLAIKKIMEQNHNNKYTALMQLCCDVYNTQSPEEITPNHLIDHNKSALIVEARHVAMFILKEYSTLGWSQIGRIFQKDHATVIHAHRVIELRVATNQLLIDTQLFYQLEQKAVKILDDES